VNKNSGPVTIFLPFFLEVIQLFVAGTNKYYNQYFNTLESDRNAYDF
jgi:hypothetical protein